MTTPAAPSRKTWRVFAMIVVLVCAVLAGLAGRYLFRQSVTTSEARLLFRGEVMATFAAPGAARLQPGCPARVTMGGDTYPGQVKMVQPERGETTVMIQLAETPRGVSPPVACSALVGLVPEKH